MSDYWTGDAPWVHDMRQNTPPAAQLLPPQGTAYVARVDGSGLTDAQQVFEQFSLHFRLPAYFGWNWAGLHECLRDMSWAPADHYLLVIERSSEMLKHRPADRETLLGILDDVGRYWGRALEHTGKSFNSFLL